MKRLLPLIISAVLAACVFSSCGTAQQKYNVTVRFEDEVEEVSATLRNSDTGDTEEAEPTLSSSESEEAAYGLNVDFEKYDRIIFTYDGVKTTEVAVNEFTGDFYVNMLGIFPSDKAPGNSDYAVKTFKYSDTEKDIYIWTPEDYDKSSGEKYPVIYMTDGQNLFGYAADPSKCWYADMCVENMIKSSGNKAIVVGIDNSTSDRDSELTPDLGDIVDISDRANYEDGTGKYFSDFVCDKVVPYIEKNYSVYTDPGHVAICGSSSGGIECFYIGMEHPEKFGTIGALSPAFALYDDQTWVEYLKTKDYSKHCPNIYIYNGGSDNLEKFLLAGAKSMPDNLSAIDYPKDKVTYKYYEKGIHTEEYWRAVYPEFLKIFYSAGNKD